MSKIQDIVVIIDCVAHTAKLYAPCLVTDYGCGVFKFPKN